MIQEAEHARTSRVAAPHETDSLASVPPVPTLSIVVPVSQDRSDIGETYLRYREIVRGLGIAHEFIYVAGYDMPQSLNALRALKEHDKRLRIVILRRSMGEAALGSGFRHVRGETILTLPADPQIDPADIPRVLAALDGADMAVGRPWPVTSSPVEHWQARAFHRLLRLLFGHGFNVLVCVVCAMRRPVIDEIMVYGPQLHLLPLLASERGFRTREVSTHEGRTGAAMRFSLSGRLRIALDILALYLVLKFTRTPLRFLGMIGLPVLLVGLVYTVVLGIARLFFGVALASRPILILGVLMIVLGIQILALGLIGELIVFAAGRRLKDYTVEKIV
jgi:Glycosyl transferase family 2